MKFLACKIDQNDSTISHRLEELELDDLDQGNVTIRVKYSGINYKDALAATGRGQICKKFPLIGGVDLAGIVETSEDDSIQVGTEVLVNGCGLGEAHHGGFSQLARVPAEWVVPLPKGLSLKESMILGTAGFTAALAIHRMQENHQHPDQGPIVVTGASGGVGSIAVDILAKTGYETIAVSGRKEHYDFLKHLGANKVCSSDELKLSSRPLSKALFAGAIDNVGGELLSQILAHTNLWGNVASIGLADHHKLDATVFPFILRGVSLLGISSTNCPMPLRKQVWDKLGGHFKPVHLANILSEEVNLTNISQAFDDLLDRKKHGRVLVNCEN